jgi:hypothetical protein
MMALCFNKSFVLPGIGFFFTYIRIHAKRLVEWSYKGLKALYQEAQVPGHVVQPSGASWIFWSPPMVQIAPMA